MGQPGCFMNYEISGLKEVQESPHVIGDYVNHHCFGGKHNYAGMPA
jgi:hypothetical protein